MAVLCRSASVYFYSSGSKVRSHTKREGYSLMWTKVKSWSNRFDNSDQNFTVFL